MSIRKAVVAMALALPLGVLAENQQQLTTKYTGLAGSQESASSLVAGLREGKEVTLTKEGATETFTPPTKKMGFGEVDNALALAEGSLKQQGITNPTPAQLEAALMGGEITNAKGETVQMKSILQLRADGQGWGQIAHSLGFKGMGDVKRADKATPPTPPTADTQAARGATKPERPAKPERPGKNR
jgi:hypothetical protein